MSTYSLDNFDFVLTVTHLVGFVTVCQNGYFFNTFRNGIAIRNERKKLHGLLMFLGFIYFQGEGIFGFTVHLLEMQFYF